MTKRQASFFHTFHLIDRDVFYLGCGILIEEETPGPQTARSRPRHSRTASQILDQMLDTQRLLEQRAIEHRAKRGFATGRTRP